MTKKQLIARNEAFQLLTIAKKILNEGGLSAYAEEVALVCSRMEADQKMLTRQELNRRLPHSS